MQTNACCLEAGKQLKKYLLEAMGKSKQEGGNSVLWSLQGPRLTFCCLMLW